ncbi:MAG: LysR family transcriptional regulator [Acutalibacteraceae bacterium]
MKINQLRFAAEIEKTGSISKAAKNLFMGQPNLSKAIRELEAEIGITLFERTRHGVEPTEKGAQFLSYARSIILQMDELEALYKPHDDTNSLDFSVSVPRATYISVGFTDFLKNVGDNISIDVHFKETSGMNAIADVARGESDIAIVRYESDCEEYYTNFIQNMNLKYELLREFDMKILMNKNHPLAKMKEVPYHLLREYIEISHGDVQEGKALTFAEKNRGKQIAGNKRTIYVYERGSQFDLLNRVEGTYMWVSSVPKTVLDFYNLVQRDCIKTSLRNKDVLVYKKTHKLTQSELKFLECVKKYIE